MKIAYSEPQRLTPISGSPSRESESGSLPASLLLISAGGALRPALLRALDRDGLCIRPGTAPPSAASVDDADVVVIDAIDSVAVGSGRGTVVQPTSSVPEGRR